MYALPDILATHYYKQAFFNEITHWLSTTKRLHLKTSHHSVHSFILSTLLQQNTKKNLLYLAHSREDALFLQNELEYLGHSVLFFPASYHTPYQVDDVDNANILTRTETLNILKEQPDKHLVLSYSEALFEKVISRKTIDKNTLKLCVNETVSPAFINEMLLSYHFIPVDFVGEPGEFSTRGGIIDIFSFADEFPFRIEFFGDEIDSIRLFDVDTQLSIKKINCLTIIPNLMINSDQSTEYLGLHEYLTATDTLLIINSTEQILHKLDIHFGEAEERFAQLTGELNHLEPHSLYFNRDAFLASLTNFSLLECDLTAYFKHDQSVQLESYPQPSFNKQFELLADDFIQNTKKGITNYLFCSNDKQIARFNDIFKDLHKNVRFDGIVGNIHQGFIDYTHKVACYTDHQFFERYHAYHYKKNANKKATISIKELTALEVGDYVTHIDHGIGRFAGLVTLNNNGKQQETIKLVYANQDVLYVNIHALHKISKYTGKDSEQVKINKLGSPAWKNLKNKTKTKAKEIAFDLIKLYASRRQQHGFSFSADTYLQHELEASFMYEDTPDQLSTTLAVKQDMESDRIMDRLICGDVGFGKTEIAIRASFKAVTDGKQVAILVPTTLLAFQHYHSFKNRLHEFPVSIDYLNRFRSTKEKNAILEKLSTGKLDILIGTHQLTNKNIAFNDLGLLIIDEEHKFGVSVKDKLKALKASVDTLTLTATPIPRTLQFSLMAARDLSVIKTPPNNRQAVETKIVPFDLTLVRDAIRFELSRAGQVFIINNRIENLTDLAGIIQGLVPDARIIIGHGQMDGKKLEQSILDFMRGHYDILISTTIIESGLDVPNANTIIINDAQNFGLADLHQMRGRVGRSNKKAFCYLIAPPYSAMTDEARKRLQAIETFSDLGAGFSIAMKDLEIRGAGNLLGAEQTGFIHDIGFDTYQKILNEAVEELKSNEFKDLFADEFTTDNMTFVKEENISLDTDSEMLIPSHYVNRVEERLALYTELSNIASPASLNTFEQKLDDRFGKLPDEVTELLLCVQLKWRCKDLGFEKLSLHKNMMLARFIRDSESLYYQSNIFKSIITYIQNNPHIAHFKEKQKKDGSSSLILQFNKIPSTQKALDTLELLWQDVIPKSS